MYKKGMFLYTNNELSDEEIKKLRKHSHLQLHQKGENIIIHLTKEVKDLEIHWKFKILMKETEEDTNKWKDIPYSKIEKFNTVKMSILPKAIYRFNANSNGIFMESQKTPKSQSNLEKKEQSWRHHTSSYSSKQYATVI